MSGDRERTAPCLHVETIAGLVDGQLGGAARFDAEKHLADCDDCYEVFTETVRLKAELSDGIPESSVSPVNRRTASARWVLLGLGAIAAILVLALWLRPSSDRTDSEVDHLMARLLVATGTWRFSEARLAEPFQWAPVSSPVRGEPLQSAKLAAERAALALRTVADRERTAKHLHATGVALLIEGRLDEGISAFSDALRLDASSIESQIDLSAALLERWRRQQDVNDAARALAAAERAVGAGPDSQAALFNRALSLEAVANITEATRAWEAYLAQDSTSKWAEEARQHLSALKGRMSPVRRPGQ